MPQPTQLLWGVWLVVAGALGVRLTFAARASARIARSGRMANARTLTLRDDIAGSLGLRRAPRVRVTDTMTGPVLAGFWRPVVLLPEWFVDELTHPDLYGVLAHELAHVRTRDLWWNAAFEAVCAIMWFHPAAWGLARTHEAACEQACDADAARLTGAPGRYRQTLARIVLDGVFLTPRLAIPMARPAHIAQRVRALTKPMKPFRVNWRRSALHALVTGVLLVTLAGLSCYRRGPKGLYETAPAATDSSYTLGPTTFTLEAVARWNRDGSARVENGRGAPSQWGGPLADHTSESKWMDVAEIRIGPAQDVFDVTAVRVFDHATQQMLGFNDDRRVGFMLDGHVVRVKSLDAPLPDELDVWLRVRHRPAEGPTWVLKPESGATTKIDGVVVKLREVHWGKGGYRLTMKTNTSTGQVQWLDSETGTQRVFLVVDFLDTQRSLRGKRYRICVVDDQGKRHWSDFFLSVDNGLTHIHSFYLAPERFRTIELTPLYQDGPFYFEKVKLPRPDPEPMLPVPAITFDVHGVEGEFVSDVFGPGSVRLTTHHGEAFSGVSSNAAGQLSLLPKQDPRNDGATLEIAVDSLSLDNVRVTPLDSSRQPIESSGSSGSGSALGPQGSLYYWYIACSLRDIARVRVTFSSEQGVLR